MPQRIVVLIFLHVISSTCVTFSLAAQEKAAIFLGPGKGWALQSGQVTYHGLLTREILRQAVLIAAREELGLTTRDYWLGELAAGATEYDLVCSPGTANLLELLVGAPPTQETVWSRPLQLKDEKLRYDLLLKGAEICSRTLFTTAIQEQVNKSKVSLPDATIDEVIASLNKADLALLDEMSAITQFAVVRKAHLARGAGAEFEAQRQEVLVRGYANLGLLTEPYWHVFHAVCKARALLYAQRWVAREPENARALHCRAYAWLMAGQAVHFHKDIKEANNLAMLRGEPIPDWAKIISAAGRYELSTLSTYPTDHPHFQLARVLAVVFMGRSGDPERAKSEIFLQGREVLSPRIFESLYDIDAEDPRTDVYQSASSHFPRQLYPTLLVLSGVSANTRALARAGVNVLDSMPEEEPAVRAMLIEALAPEKMAPADANDANFELSNRALATIIREATFFHAWHFAYHGERSEKNAALFEQAISTHPFREALKVLPIYWSDIIEGRPVRATIERLDLDAVEWKERELFNLFPNVDQIAFRNSYAAAERHRDLVTADLLTMFAGRATPGQIGVAKSILEIDPYNPVARTLLLTHDWQSFQKDAKDWAATAGEHTALAIVVAKRLESDKDLKGAEELLKAAVKNSGQLNNYRALSLFYERQDKQDDWLKTWDAFLSNNPESPDCVKVQNSLAKAFIVRKNISLAEKYALAAAESGKLVGARTLGNVREIQEKWGEAEENYRKHSQYSMEDASDWFLFCQRAGLKAPDESRQLAEQNFEEFLNPRTARRFSNVRTDLFDMRRAGTIGLALGQPEQALKYFQQGFTRNADPLVGFQAVLVAMELKQPEARDRLLKRISEEARLSGDKDTAPSFKALANQLRTDLAAGGKGAIDFAVTQETAARVVYRERLDYFYFVGRYLELCGNLEVAKQAYIECLRLLEIDHPSRTLAGMGLSRLGGGPADYRLPELKNEKAE